MWKRVLEWANAEWRRMLKAQNEKKDKQAKTTATATPAPAATATASSGGAPPGGPTTGGDTKTTGTDALVVPDLKEFTPEVRSYLLADIVPHIRFPLFPIQDLASTVAPLKLLSNDNMLKVSAVLLLLC